MSELKEKILRAKEDLDAVYEAGKQSGGGGAADYLPFTTTAKFPDWNLFGKSEVVLNVPLVTNFSAVFQSVVLNTTVEHLTINGALDGTITTATMFVYANARDDTLKRLTLNCDFSKCTSFTYMATYRSALEIIDGIPIDFSSATGIGDIAGQCYALREMRIVPLSIKGDIKIGHANNLSNETVQSLIDGLADLTGGATKTLTLHTSVVTRLTESQLETIQNKNWQVA